MSELPVYNPLHGGHCSTDPRYATVGYDVIRTNSGETGTLIEVTAVIADAGSYLAALELAKTYRRIEGQFGYTADRYACGCRWIGTALGGNVTFRDLTVAVPA